MTVRSFDVRAAAFERDEDIETEYLVMAEFPDGDGRRLEVQRAFEFDEQDRKQGMDTYCIVDESGACYYGDVRAWRLIGDLVEIELEPPAARVFGTDRFALRLLGPGAPTSTVKAGLEALLG